MTFSAGIGLLSLAVWLYLLVARGGYWLARERDDGPLAVPPRWPAVVAVVPARNEADVIARSIGSLLAQDYGGPFRVVLVDDGSSDGTSAVAKAIQSERRLDVVAGTDLPAGWTGKLWALEQGIRHATAAGDAIDYFLLTDADIGHSRDNLSHLVARSELDGRVQVSQMAELSCATLAERFLIPAFVYFFQMLYPFGWVAQQDRATAAAAGGCTLVRRKALEGAGGIPAIRSEIIDDCALARRLKGQGPIWLGLTRRATSLRPYGGFLKIGHMISRSAYAQLGYSPLALAGTVAAMGLVYIAPPLLALLSDGPARWLGLCAWLVMVVTFQPMLHFYRRSPLWGLALPAIGAVYAFFTVQSAIDFWRGRGGLWKGRVQAIAGRLVTGAADFASGKGHRDENFPVASRLVRAELRPTILAFYRFARAADDVADHESASPERKLAQLERLEAGLRGETGASAEGERLRVALQARALTDRHALDLLEAFRRDVTKRRYSDWAELMDYCRCSASPVGRFVLDLHGESTALWPLNDALCNALQVINHLQDCAKDYRQLDRVYVPVDVLSAAGLGAESLGDPQASPALREVIAALARRTGALLDQSRPFADGIVDRRLALEVGIIQALAESLVHRLERRDPLSERVHHRKVEAAGLALRGGLGVALRRLRRMAGSHQPRLRGSRR